MKADLASRIGEKIGIVWGFFLLLCAAAGALAVVVGLWRVVLA